MKHCKFTDNSKLFYVAVINNIKSQFVLTSNLINYMYIYIIWHRIGGNIEKYLLYV